MKGIITGIAALLAIGTFATTLAFGKTTRKEVLIVAPVTVNGTVLERGTYKVTYDSETEEITFKKGGKVVATSPARLDKTKDHYSVFTRGDSNDPAKPPALVSILLYDGNQATILDTAAKATSVRP